MNGNKHPGDTRAIGSGGPQGPVAPRYGAPPNGPAPQPGPPHPHGQPHPHAAPFGGQPGPGGYGGPPAAPPAGRGNELMAGSNTVFEFTGSEAHRDHRGSRGTFMGATLDLGNAKEERETNLRSGPSSWIFLGVALLLGGGAVAYAMLGNSGQTASPAEDAAASVAAVDQAVPTPTEGEAKAAGSSGGDESGSGGDAGSGGDTAADAKAPADDTKADAPAAADPPKAAPVEPEPATPVEPAKPSPTKSSGTKKPAPKKTEPKKPAPKKTGKTLSPKKPPRGLPDLPKPPE